MSIGIEIPLGVSGTMTWSYGDLPVMGTNVSIPALVLQAEGSPSSGADFSFILPMLSLEAEGSLSGIGDGNMLIPLWRASGVGVQSEVSNLDVAIPMFRLSAAGEATITGNLSVVLPRLMLYTNSWIDNVGSLSASLPSMRLDMVAPTGDSGDGTITLPFFTLSASGILSTEGTVAITLPIYKLLTEVVAETYLSMALNIRNFALTNLSNYKFNSFARFNGVHLGATGTKIFNLDSVESTDDGSEIDWNFRIPFLDLEMKTSKRLRQAWVSFKSSGDIIVTAIYPDGTEYEYDLTGYEITEDGVRVKFGRGLRNRYIALDFKSKDGSTIDLDTIRLNLDEYGGR
jgi:hypothetical protein